MKKKIKMIGLDLDGTLLNSRKELTEYTRTVMKRAIEQGVVVPVATGRPISAVPAELQTFPGMRYMVTANGARIVDVEKDEVIYENLLPVESAEKVLDILKKYDTIHEVFIDGKGYTYGKGLENVYHYFKEPSMAEYLLTTRTPVEDVSQTLRQMNKNADKVHGVFHNLEERRKALERLKEVSGIDVTAAFGNTIEVNQAGTNKGLGLLNLGKLLGIQREEIMACGDGMNDYEMLKAVGFGVAMENGHSRVKEIADYITGTNDEDGVAKAIEKFVLQ